MFRITEDPSSGSLVQCFAKNYKINSLTWIRSVLSQYIPIRCACVCVCSALYTNIWVLCDPKHVGALLNIL